MSKNTKFEPDFNKKKFEITITVHVNSSTITMTSFDDYKPDYAEMVGVLEIQKSMMLYDQSAYNRKRFEELNEQSETI